MQKQRVICGLLSSTLTWVGCNIAPPPVNPEFTRTERRLSGELTDAHVALDRAEQELRKHQLEEVAIRAEIEQIVGDAQAARYAHKSAVSSREKYIEGIAKGLQLGEQCQHNTEAPVDVDDVVKTREYLLQFVAHEQRDTALRALAACIKLFTRRLKAAYTQEAVENRRTFAIALEDAFDEINNWSRGRFHARVQGKRLNVSMRGNFEGRARHSREEVENWCSHPDAYVFEQITLRNAHGTFSCKPVFNVDDVVANNLFRVGLGDRTESILDGSERVPPEPGPAPTPNTETSNQHERLAYIKRVNQSAADSQASARLRTIELDGKLTNLRGAEARRIAAWRHVHEERAKKEKVAGGLTLGVGGLDLVVTGFLFYRHLKKRNELETGRDQAEASAFILETAGASTDYLDATIDRLGRNIRREEKRLWTTAIVGLSIGVPVIAVGVILYLTGVRRRQQAQRFSLTADGVLIRF